MKKLLVLCSIILLFAVAFSGCTEFDTQTSTNGDKFIGAWQETATGNTGVYSRDGTYVFTYANCGECQYTGTWELVNGRLIIIYPDEGLSYTFDYYFENNDGTLYKRLVGEDHYDIWYRIA